MSRRCLRLLGETTKHKATLRFSKRAHAELRHQQELERRRAWLEPLPTLRVSDDEAHTIDLLDIGGHSYATKLYR